MDFQERVCEVVEPAADGERAGSVLDIAGGLRKIRRFRTVVILVIVVLTLAGGWLVVRNMNRPPNWPEITDELVLHWLHQADTTLPDFKKLDWDDPVRDPYLRILCLAGDFKRAERRVGG